MWLAPWNQQQETTSTEAEVEVEEIDDVSVKTKADANITHQFYTWWNGNKTRNHNTSFMYTHHCVAFI